MTMIAWWRRRFLGRCSGWRYVPGDLGRPAVLWCSLPYGHAERHVARDLQQPNLLRTWP